MTKNYEQLKNKIAEVASTKKIYGLCDVLLAMEIDEADGSDDRLTKAEIVIMMWNKYDDNLDNQSDETKQFLIKLLVC